MSLAKLREKNRELCDTLSMKMNNWHVFMVNKNRSKTKTKKKIEKRTKVLTNSEVKRLSASLGPEPYIYLFVGFRMV